MEGFGGNSIDVGELHEVYGEAFYGSRSRSGLEIEYGDAVFDVCPSPDTIEVEANGKRQDLSWLNERLDPNFVHCEKSNRFANVYAEDFHEDYGLISIHNRVSLLIVS